VWLFRACRITSPSVGAAREAKAADQITAMSADEFKAVEELAYQINNYFDWQTADGTRSVPATIICRCDTGPAITVRLPE